jgi:hypothetical protein
MRSWIQQTSAFHMPHCHASIFIFGFHKHPPFLETVMSEIQGFHNIVAVNVSLHARRMTSLSMLILSGEIIFSERNNDSACQTVHHVTS